MNAELGGGGGAVASDTLLRTECGLRRMLQGIGILPGDGTDPGATGGTREMHIEAVVHTYDRDVVERLPGTDDAVDIGAPLASIHHPDDPTRAPIPITTPYSGMILAKRTLGRVERGDALCPDRPRCH